MRKSINIWSFPAEWTLEAKLRLARAAGFAGIELDLTLDGAVSLGSSTVELDAVRAQVEREGLEVSGLATGLYWQFNPVSEDPTVREEARTVLRRQIECAAQLGIDTVLVVPGAVGIPWEARAAIVPYDTAHTRAADFIRRAMPLAERHRVVLGIENVWNQFLPSPVVMAVFIDSFASPWVAAYLDVGNAIAAGHAEHWAKILGPRIRRVHFKDYRRAIGTVHGFVDLLSGDVNWPEVMRELRAANYAGWVAAEMIPPAPFYRHCPEVLIHNTSRAMDAILAL